MVWLTVLEKKIAILLCCSNFTGCVQSKNGVDLIKVSIFYKLEKTNSQTVWAIEIKKVALFYYHVRVVFKLFCSLYKPLTMAAKICNKNQIH